MRGPLSVGTTARSTPAPNDSVALRLSPPLRIRVIGDGQTATRGNGNNRAVIHPQFQLCTGGHFNGLPDMHRVARSQRFPPAASLAEALPGQSQHLTRLRLGRCLLRTASARTTLIAAIQYRLRM
jgi:hypothetical protein